MGRPKKLLTDADGKNLMPQIISEYLAGMTLMEIAAKYNVSDMTIFNRLKEAGIPARSRHRRYGKKVQPRLSILDPDLVEKVKIRREMGLNDYEIARLLNISVKDIMRVGKDANN